MLLKGFSIWRKHVSAAFASFLDLFFRSYTAMGIPAIVSTNSTCCNLVDSSKSNGYAPHCVVESQRSFYSDNFHDEKEYKSK